jgi:phosphomannomutase
MSEIHDLNKEASFKKAIIFDVDKTLTLSKSPLDKEMADLLGKLLKVYKIDIISGAKFEQMERQIIEYLSFAKENFSDLYFQPTSGGSLYEFKNGEWQIVYKNEISENDRERIITALEGAIEEAGIEKPEKLFGERIEDRGSQITFSNFGQEAPLEVKKNWDPSLRKRKKIQIILKPKLPNYNILIGGSTSIDVIGKGIDKKYGVERLVEYLNIPIKEMLFIGDRLEPGGNDSSVVGTGIDWIDVEGLEETKKVIRELIEAKF